MPRSGNPGLSPSLESTDPQRVTGLTQRPSDIHGRDRGASAATDLGVRALAHRIHQGLEVGCGGGARQQVRPIGVGGDQEPAPGARALVCEGVRELLGSGPLQAHHHHLRVPVEPEAREAAGRLGSAQLTQGQPVEEVSLQAALSVGDRAGLRELHRDEAEGVTRDDAIRLARLLGLAHRQERLDATLGTDGLDPDMVPSVDQR